MDILLEHAQKKRNAQLIKKRALELGFLACGIAKAEFLEKEAPHLENYLKEKRNGQLSYMENHFDKRLDPRLLVDGAKSVVSLLYNYYPEKKQKKETYKISKYAYGEDYHFVVKDKMQELMKYIREEIGDVNGRVFTDSAPILEGAWAKRAGLGWMGKHSLLITKTNGSFFFLGELIIDLELDYDTPFTSDHCGTCTRCIDSCPTEAIVADKKIDASKCISYFTIELKDEIPSEMKGKFNDWMFGCDICQDVCPWNRFSKPHEEERFFPNEEIMNYSKSDWEQISEDLFKNIFKKSPVKRTKFTGLTRNIKFLSEK